MKKGNESIAHLDSGLERDHFLRCLIRHLSGTLQDTVGLREAEGFIAVVGRAMGSEIDQLYKTTLQTDQLHVEQVAAALVDLKEKIGGEFRLVEMTSDRLVFANTRCPFGNSVDDRPSLCMMTSSVFGTIAAKNLGYAKVTLGETIASGSSKCHVVVHLNYDSPETQAAEGKEYFEEA